MTPPDAPTTWHCQPEMAASNPRENGPFVSRRSVLGEQDRAHRRAFPRPRSSLCDSCWPLETPCGHPLPSVPWQMVVSLPFLPWAYQLLLGIPSPVLLPEASLSRLLRQREQSVPALPGLCGHLKCPDMHPVLFCMGTIGELYLPAIGLIYPTQAGRVLKEVSDTINRARMETRSLDFGLSTNQLSDLGHLFHSLVNL